MLAIDLPALWKGRFRDGFLTYIIPTIVVLILGLFLVLPVGMLVAKSFMGAQGFTLDYFKLLFQNQHYISSIFNSIQVGLCSTLVATLISIPLSLIHVKCKFKGKSILFGLILLPM